MISPQNQKIFIAKTNFCIIAMDSALREENIIDHPEEDPIWPGINADSHAAQGILCKSFLP